MSRQSSWLALDSATATSGVTPQVASDSFASRRRVGIVCIICRIPAACPAKHVLMSSFAFGSILIGGWGSGPREGAREEPGGGGRGGALL